MVNDAVRATDYETVIGLEVHVQLQTRSKMFCGCPADYQTASPNSRVCPVCLGLPGTLPVINRRAVEYTIMTGLALGCDIPEYSKFDRKNYPYPDLMKGYQISQFDLPLAQHGCLEIQVEGETRAIGVDRVHLEEDAAKLQHFPAQHGESYSLVDVNRAGVPLMEIVSAPDLRSPEEARIYLMTLHSILQYLGVSTANMQDGNFRCDANVSIRPRGRQEYGTRTEVKNMNSFRSVFLALNYEVDRHRRILEDGGRIAQETRGWVEEIRGRLPELAGQRRQRFMAQYGLPEYDAALLTGSKDLADYFETAMGQQQRTGPALESFAKNVSNWMLGDLSRLLNLANQTIAQTRVRPGHLVALINLIEGGSLSGTLAKTVLEEAFASGEEPDKIVADRGYAQINDASVVSSAVAQAIAQNPKAVADYVNGKDTAARFLVGQVMKITRGQAKPELALQLVQQALEAAKNAETTHRLR